MQTAGQFKALRVQESGGQFHQSIVNRSLEELPEREVLISVQYSSLNYKDALSATGNKGVTKNYPHTPGCDAAGEVVESHNSSFKKGDPVIVTGYDLGMNTDGGFSQMIRVPSDWVVPLPEGLTLKESMMLGTAGFTAGLALHKLQNNGQTPGMGGIIVSGATGGVGSISLQVLNKFGFHTIASTRKLEQENYLYDIGATEVRDSSGLAEPSDKPMVRQSWAGGIDTVGGEPLVNILKGTQLHGNVVTCGNAASPELNMTVLPFILRGVSLLGVTASNTDMTLRRRIWQNLAGPWKPEALEKTCRTVTLKELPEWIDAMLEGSLTGRVVVDCRG